GGFGGGGGVNGSTISSTGGPGGFGGGGGSGGTTGGTPGFGGGGGGVQNVAGGGAGLGGAIFNAAGAVTITNSTLTGNTAQGGGTGAGSGNGSGYGGALFNLNGSLTLINDTLAGNTVAAGTGGGGGSADGGALYTLGLDGVLASAVSGQTATIGLAADAQDKFINTLFANSTGGSDIVNNNSTVSNSSSNNLATQSTGLPTGVSATTTAALNLDSMPANNGGPTPTLALNSPSSAIDTGFDTTQAPYNLTTDQRGLQRKVNGKVDVGAYEFGAAVVLLVSGFPTSTFAGAAHTVTVTAQAPNGQVVTSYNGTVAITSSDGHAGLPTSMPLTNGVGTFTVTLKTPGLQSISASDGTISGSESGIIVDNATNYAQVDTTVDLNNDTVVLLDNPSGGALVQTLDSHFNVLHSNNFAIAGWTAIKVAAGGDGLTRLLWVQNGRGAADLWLLNADDTVNSTLQIPFFVSGWQPVDVAVGSGASSQTRLLWFNGGSGQAAVWTVNNNFNLAMFNPVSNAVVFGPVPGWRVQALAVSPTDVPWLLWDHDSTGQAALWTLNTDNTFLNGAGYTPLTSGWTAEEVTVASDGNGRLLWDNTDGTAAIWTINGGSLLDMGASVYGPFAGFTAVALEGGGDGLTRLVWTSSGGTQAVWLIDASGFLTSSTTFSF
ncbi:MAG: hypothetical protein JO112_01815, partial [Planctomycetes bacterium]|nr:hypothetical protein [Planctomycetota bacterium]